MSTPDLEQVIEALRTIEALASTYDGDPDRVVIARTKSYGPGLMGLYVTVRLVDLQRAGQAADWLERGRFPQQVADGALGELLLAIERGEVGLRLAPGQDELDLYVGSVKYETSNGWQLVVFIDCGSWDYIESATSPDGVPVAGSVVDSVRYYPAPKRAREVWGVEADASWPGWKPELFDTPAPAPDRWRRFADEPIPAGEEVLVWDGIHTFIAVIHGDWVDTVGGPSWRGAERDRLHWRPLPAPPKEEEE